MTGRLPSKPPVLSGFTYIRPLGTGGFADVFLFEQQMPRRPVAVKVLLKNATNPELLNMFKAEADAMAALSAHPSIATIYEASVSQDGRPYIVMEYCPDSFANSYRTNQYPIHQVLQIAIKVGSALETAHRAGVLHRDIKPANILITQYGAAVLSDFGISTSIKRNIERELFVMSIPWSAPEVVSEQISGSVQSEVWALAATVYSLLGSRSPFEKPGKGQNTRDKIKARIEQGRFFPIGRPDVPKRLEIALAKAMSKEPKNRFSSILDFLLELQLVEAELGLVSTPLEVVTNDLQFSPSNSSSQAEFQPNISVVESDTKRKQAPSPAIVRPEDALFDDDKRSGVSGRKLGLIIGASVIGASAVTLGVLMLTGLL